YEQDYSYYFYAALLDAADRGVKVRIVVDGKLGKLSGSLDTLGRLLQNHNNIEFYYFNMINLLDPSGLLVLLHDKVMLVDGQIAIVGGVNMGTGAFLGNYDMEIMISNGAENGCCGAMARYFDGLIANELTARIVSDFVDLAAKTRYIDAYREFYGRSELATAEIDYKTQGVAVDKATFLTNEVSADKKSPIILQAVYNLTENSQKATFVTPYALLENDKKREIKRLAASCSDFTLVTNSLYNTRNVAYADYYYTRKAYIDDDIRLLEYQ
ncbi:MAG: phospholipase D-like domain-containing protein, partial [Clostridia bacterium]|nr:phospholipase D-like domain-containing protein [Clostridia bacterium]